MLSDGWLTECCYMFDRRVLGKCLKVFIKGDSHLYLFDILVWKFHSWKCFKTS